ncbi:PLDc N-terminal domain-containing protein [Mycobacterium sp. BMJ-28]
MPFFSMLFLALLVGAIVDIAGADEQRIRGLPRTTWILLVVLVPLAGSIAWFIAGRPARLPRVLDTPVRPDHDDPQAEAEFRRQCRERAEQQRRAADQQPSDEPG